MHFGKAGPLRRAASVLAAAIPASTPAYAALADWVLAPPSFALGSAELRLSGAAHGAPFSPRQPGWRHHSNAEIAAMPLKAGASNAALRGVMPPSA